MGYKLVTGTMGGGKTYYVVEECLRCWKEGGVVHSNIDWNLEELERLGYAERHVKLPDDVTQWLSVFVGGKEGAENVVAVDEGALIFHVWDLQEAKKRDRDLFECLAMSRKLGLDIYFISQSAENVNAAMRRMANFEVRCVSVKMIPYLGALLARFKGDFLRVTRTGEKRQEVGRSYHRFNPAVGRAYKTEEVRGVATTIKRSATRQASTVSTPTRWRIAIAVMLLAIVAGVYGMGRGVSKAINGVKDLANESGPSSGSSPAPSSTAKSKDSTIAERSPAVTSRKPVMQLQWFEFPVENELVIASVSYGAGIVVRTVDGRRWQLGEPCDTSHVDSLRRAGQCWAVTLADGTHYLLRRMTHDERMAIFEEQRQRAPQPVQGAQPPAGTFPGVTMPGMKPLIAQMP